MNSQAGLISCRLWSSPGWPEWQDSCPSYASGGPAQGRHSWCGSPHTQASHPNAFGHDSAPSRHFVRNATVGAEGDLPPLSTYRQGCPSQAPPHVEARQHELLVDAEREIWGHHSRQAGRFG